MGTGIDPFQFDGSMIGSLSNLLAKRIAALLVVSQPEYTTNDKSWIDVTEDKIFGRGHYDSCSIDEVPLSQNSG